MKWFEQLLKNPSIFRERRVAVPVISIAMIGLLSVMVAAGLIHPLSPGPSDFLVLFVVIAVIAGMLWAYGPAKGQTDGSDKVQELADRLLKETRSRDELLHQEIEGLKKAIAALLEAKQTPDPPKGIDDALKALEQGETGAAEMIFAEVLARKISEGKAATKEAAAAARHLGALAYLHDTEAALGAYRQAVDLDPNDPEGWNRLGHLLYRIGELGEAEAAYNQVQEIGLQTGDQETVAIALGNLGNIHRTHGNLNRAVELYEKARTLNEELGNKEGVATAYSNLGNVHLIREHLDQAVEMFERALAIDNELGNQDGMANAYGSLGNVYRKRADLDRAVEMYEKALTIHTALGHKEGMASDFGNLGIVYRMRGKLDRAVGMYEKALAVNEKLGRKQGMAIQYANLGNVYLTREDLEQAVEMFDLALAIHEELGLKPGMAEIYGNLGIVYQMRDDTEKACDYWERALELYREMKIPDKIEQVEGLMKEAGCDEA